MVYIPGLSRWKCYHSVPSWLKLQQFQQCSAEDIFVFPVILSNILSNSRMCVYVLCWFSKLLEASQVNMGFVHGKWLPLFLESCCKIRACDSWTILVMALHLISSGGEIEGTLEFKIKPNVCFFNITAHRHPQTAFWQDYPRGLPKLLFDISRSCILAHSLGCSFKSMDGWCL